MLELQADRGAEYDEGIRTANRELKSVKDSLRKVEADIRDAGAGERRQRRIVEVDLEAPAAGSARIDLSYLVLGPGWQPVYDVRVDSGSRSMEVNYFALVRQNSGEDWSGVDLRLSTARPGLGGEHPELAVWRIGVANDARLGGQSINRFPNSFDVETGQRTAPVVRSAGLVLDSVVAGVRRDMTVRQAENSTQGTAVLFAVSGKSDVVSDNVEHRVAVSSLSMPAHFRYSCVPKLDRYVYLKAMGKNQTDYPLLQGNANIYLDGSYVATSGLDFVAPGETFWAFLGVDESIQVDYKLINKHESREGLTGRTVRHTHEYLFTVKNTHDEAEELIIFDQLPISDNENVEVELLTPKVAKNSDALEINDEKRIKWFLVLKPGEEREIPFVFQVEAPHDVEIDGLE
ncbi:MAG: DUF4139 domain-containing protein, partial [Pontiellaceae bacterium]|nr:DUF4139 domain-containing protein [Pontiellaceae bacterium]